MGPVVFHLLQVSIKIPTAGICEELEKGTQNPSVYLKIGKQWNEPASKR